MFAPQNKHILLVVNDEVALARLGEYLTGLGYPLTPCRTLEDALDLDPGRDFDLLILGPVDASLDLLPAIRSLRRRFRDAPVIVAAPHGAIRPAVAALRNGADDYISLPADRNEVRMRVGRILEVRDLDRTMAYLHDEIVRRTDTRQLIGESPTMRSVVSRIQRIAPTRTTILIVGESGVGKELVARAIHYASPRRTRSFVALNCAAIPESLIESELFGHEKGAFTGAVARAQGKFELAHRGTLFLDEIGEMTPSAQVKLLRVLEEHEFLRVGGTQWIRVDVRVLAATNANLEAMVEEGRFRKDLYFRFKVVTLTVPPLRERREDIPVLARHFVDQISRANNMPGRRLTESAISVLQSYPWPGNVREMKNLLESVLITTVGESIDAGDFPTRLREPGTSASNHVETKAGMSMKDMERELIRRTLEFTRGNRTRAARILQIGVRTLQRKIAQYELT